MVLKKSRRGGRVERLYNRVNRQAKKIKQLFLNFFNTRRQTGVSREDIICFQMGKVGSQTVYYSLMSAYKDLGLDIEVHHLHRLSGLDKNEEKIIRERKYPKPALVHRRRCQDIVKKMAKNPDKKWNLVSMVRDPVSQNVSAFFQTLEEFVPGWFESYDSGELDLEELIEMFLSSKRHDVADVADSWFDKQMKVVFGIDVFEEQFPKEKGYAIYNKLGHTQLLLMRLENLNLCAEKAMKEYLGLKNFILVNINVGDGKYYSKPYQDFKKKVSLPVEYVERICSTKFARHFYTDEELEGVIKKWSGVKDI